MNFEELFSEHISYLQNEYNKILEKNNIEHLIIHSGQLKYAFLDDLQYPFKVNPHFKYFVPVTNNPNCFLHIRKAEKPVLYYYNPTDFWHEQAGDPEGFWVNEFDIKIITNVDQAKEKLSNLPHSTYIGEHADELASWNFTKSNPEEFLHEVHFMRAAKTEYERANLREANKVAAKAHLAARDAFYAGGTEFEINHAYLKSAGILEHQEPYGNIVALNEKGAILHYTNLRTQKFSKENTHSFLIDAGYDLNGYAADITRTYSFKNDEFSELVRAMDGVLLKSIEDFKIDVAYTESHLKSHTYIAELLKQFKFVDLDPEAIVEKKISKIFFPHGLGHFLGLQVHDVGGYLQNPLGTQVTPPEDHPFLRCTRVIQKGHVFTVEPGLYFIDPLLKDLKNSENAKYINWEKVDSFRKFGGIRMEDNIFMTETGKENFTRNAFKQLKK
jgi:Xaa-Pro dipeptidase